MKTATKLTIGVAVLAAASPVGLLVPSLLKAGGAWGEWGADEIASMTGYVPAGLEKLSSLWNPLLPDYAFRGSENAGAGVASAAYIFSAIIGIALCAGAGWLIGKALSRKKS